MRISLALTAVSLLLVGAGCSDMDKTSVNPTQNLETKESETDSAEVIPENLVDLEATTTAKTPTACTMDAKACPDGSYVGRTGPNCEFAACPTVKTEEKPTVEATKPTGPATYTMADVQAKAAAGQCWSVISGKVYDLTSWITKHPGGQAAIKSLCGIDGTAKFQAMHGGQAKAEKALTSYFVGSLK